MKKLFTLFLLLSGLSLSQTLVNSFPFPRYTPYDYFWGVTKQDDKFLITTTINKNVYQVSKTGVILDSVVINSPLADNSGIEWDGTNFWISERLKLTGGARIYKFDSAGALVDSFKAPPVQGSPVISIGDLAVDGDKIWYTVFNPDYPAYPNGWAYAFNKNTMQIVDSIPLRGRQVIGIAVNGDTVFYCTNKQSSTPDTERIFAYSKSLGDTLFSFPAPDPDGTCNPRALYWDGSYLNLIAERVGSSSWVYKTLYQYSIDGGGNPVINLSAGEFDFGKVIIGQSAEQTFYISNTGNEDLLITQFEITNAAFLIAAPVYPDTIKPGSAKSYMVSFNPIQFDSAFADLKIHSNDVVTGVKIVKLKGKGIYNGSVLYTASSSYDYGVRRVSSKCGWKFVIQNRGNESLEISSAQFTNSVYTIDTTGITFPLTIEPQVQREFRVWFTPSETGSFNDSLLISSNAVNIPLLKIFINGSGQSDVFNMGEIFWEGQIPHNPYSYSNDYLPVSMKRIRDVNGDGVDDIIISSKNYFVTCYNGNSSVIGDILWSFNTGLNNNNTGSVMFEDALQIRNDVDNDGIEDVVFGCGGGNEFVYTVSGRTGNLIWAYGDSIDYNRGDINGVRADKDFNNDGINDVVVSASGSSGGGRHSAICLNGTNGNEIFNLVQNASYTFDITTMDNGGIIAVDLGNGGPYYINGFTTAGLFTWTVSVPDVVWSLRQTRDLNNDGKNDFVGYSGGIDVNLFARSGANGSILWNVPYPDYSVFGNIKLISDLDGNGFEDMIFAGKEGVHRYDTKLGTSRWSNMLDGSYVFGVDEMGDLNSDGINEIAAATKNSWVYILNGKDGVTIYQYSFGAPINYAAERVINIGSIDGNYSTDFTAASKNGKIVCFSGGTAGPLPVELTAFSAEVMGNSVLLKWETATELNNSGFRVVVNDKEYLFIEGAGTTGERNIYSAAIENLYPGVYNILLIQVDYDGTETITAEKEVEISSLPVNFALYQNYPNPFNPSTIINFDVPFDSRIEIVVYDILGNTVASYPVQEFKGGTYNFEFNASALSSGVYLYRINAYKSGNPVYTYTRKMMVIK